MQPSRFVVAVLLACLFLCGGDSLWKSIINAKYTCKQFDLIPSYSRFSSSKSPWFAISKLKDVVASQSKWEIHNGNSIRFWLDNWTGVGPLAAAFPRFFVLSSCRDLTIRQAWSEEEQAWNIRPNRVLFDREISRWSLISSEWPKPATLSSRADVLLWTASSNHIFSVASLRSLMQEVPLTSAPDQLSTSFWSSIIPKNVKVFLWTCFNGGLNTGETIQRRYKDLSLQPNWCCFCKNSEESSNHISKHS